MSNQSICIYVPAISPRLLYVVGEVFERNFGLKVDICIDKSSFLQLAMPKLSYGEFVQDDIPYFAAAGLLEETGIIAKENIVGTNQAKKVLFPIANELQSALPYDAFSAIFYMLSRYEEYLPFQTDQHGRYAAEQSLAFKNGFLHEPVVQCWLAAIEKVLQGCFPSLVFKKHDYTFTPSFDIDVAYAYQHRTLIRQWLGLGKAVFELKFHYFFRRILVLLGLQKDPFDTYQALFEVLNAEGLSALFFLQAGKYAGDVDKSILKDTPFWRKFTQQLAAHGQVGIHPSYASNYAKEKLSAEMDLVKSLLGHPVQHSRQHYLKLRFPQTYRNLAYFGIQHDYSMGFADACGFRAGTCRPFYFYDLTVEMATNVLVHPFVIMDATLKNYLKLNQTAAMQVFNDYKITIQAVGGDFTILCHNNTFSDMEEWKSWKAVFYTMLKSGKA